MKNFSKAAFLNEMNKLNEAQAEENDIRLNEKVLLKVGNNYDVFDQDKRDWREAMEFLGYDKKKKEYMFRAWNSSPGKADITLIAVPQSREMKDIM
jgi:hypothetical protein|tara:strand:+ start:395 stop:682 length:288 start_codon:yes stop_codon:yes gene_type:complete